MKKIILISALTLSLPCLAQSNPGQTSPGLAAPAPTPSTTNPTTNNPAPNSSLDESSAHQSPSMKKNKKGTYNTQQNGKNNDQPGDYSTEPIHKKN